MLSSPTPPNPFDSIEQHARQNPIIAAFEQKLQGYSLILLSGLVLTLVLLVSTWLIVATRTPDYKLGNTIFQVVTPAPFSQIQGVTEVKINMVTTLQPKILKAFVSGGSDMASELVISEVGKSVIQLTGTWNTQTATSDQMQISLYNVSQLDHPVLVGQMLVPVTIIH